MTPCRQQIALGTERQAHRFLSARPSEWSFPCSVSKVPGRDACAIDRAGGEMLAVRSEAKRSDTVRGRLDGQGSGRGPLAGRGALPHFDGPAVISGNQGAAIGPKMQSTDFGPRVSQARDFGSRVEV